MMTKAVIATSTIPVNHDGILNEFAAAFETAFA